MTLLGGQVRSFAGKRHPVGSVNFDGTNDWLTRGADLTGIVDGKAGTLSFWFDLTGGDAASRLFLSNSVVTNARFMVARSGANNIAVTGRNAANTIILNIVSTTSHIATDGWTHILAAWDLAAGIGKMYVNDVSVLAGSPTLTNDTIDYADGDFSVGAAVAGTSKMIADLAEIWFNTAYIDIGDPANRRKFITAGLKPAQLEFDGRGPTGSAPLLYLAAPLQSFHLNRGAGGAFTVNGALTAGASSPSD